MMLRMYLRWAERRGFERRGRRGDRGPGGRPPLGDVHRAGPFRLRAAVGRARRPPPRAHVAVRLPAPAADELRLARRHPLPRGRSTTRSTSTRRTCASTPTAPRARAASTSTRPTRRCGSPTCRPASSSRARTSAASTRTRPRRCRSSRPSWPSGNARERQAELDAIVGTAADVAWGNQIRSYVLAPYQLVKDHPHRIRDRQRRRRPRRRPRRCSSRPSCGGAGATAPETGPGRCTGGTHGAVLSVELHHVGVRCAPLVASRGGSTMLARHGGRIVPRTARACRSCTVGDGGRRTGPIVG